MFLDTPVIDHPSEYGRFAKPKIPSKVMELVLAKATSESWILVRSIDLGYPIMLEYMIGELMRVHPIKRVVSVSRWPVSAFVSKCHHDIRWTGAQTD